MARGNYIYPPEATMRLTTDIFEYCRKHVPKWNTISISGYHIREKGCSAVQEVAFTLSNAIAYVEAALDRGLAVDDFAPRLAFFFNCHNNVFQEIAKFRAVRRMWARIMRERFGATDERSKTIRFHTQTGGVTLQAQQPEVNIIRVALQGFAAVCGGTQSLHTNGFDEALALPTERSARIALRTQQVLAHESGAADSADPFAGSYFIESLTDEIEARAWELIDKVEQLGGSVEALEFIQREIEESAASYHERYRSGQDIIVGVNKYVTEQVDDVEILRVDPESERRQVERLTEFKDGSRPGGGRRAARRSFARSPQGEGNLLYPIKDALRAGASIGEVCGAMRDVVRRVQGRRVLLASLAPGPESSAMDARGRSRLRMAEARGHGIEDEADAGQVRARAVGAGGRPRTPKARNCAANVASAPCSSGTRPSAPPSWRSSADSSEDVERGPTWSRKAPIAASGSSSTSVASETAGVGPSGSRWSRTSDRADTRANVSISGPISRRAARIRSASGSVPSTAPSMTASERPRRSSGICGNGGRLRIRKEVVTASGASGAQQAQRCRTCSASERSHTSMPA